MSGMYLESDNLGQIKRKRKSRNVVEMDAREAAPRYFVSSSLRGFVGGTGDAELFHPATQRIGMQIENPRSPLGTVDHAVGFLEHGDDMTLFNFFERDQAKAGGGVLNGFGSGRDFQKFNMRPFYWEQIGPQLQHLPLTQGYTTFDNILQFANIPRPRVSHEKFHGVLGDALNFLAAVLRKAREEKQH
jgi:hypothetical protein